MDSRDSSSSGSRSCRKSRSRSYRSSRERSRSPSPSRNSFGTRLHVGDIDSRLTKRDLVSAFQKFGPLVEVWIAKSSPCFGFVVFECKEDADEALDAMNGHTLGNSRLRVTYALPRVYERSRKPSSYMGARCYHCGERGHFLRDCHFQRRFQYRFRPRSPMARRYLRSRSHSRKRSRDRSNGKSRDHDRSRGERVKSRRTSRSWSRDSSSRGSAASVAGVREDK